MHFLWLKSDWRYTRVCPGKLFADTTLFLVIANIAATLDIRKARDGDGKEITPEVSFQPAFVRYATFLRVSFLPN